MAGYSGTPLPRKLGMKPGASVAILQAPRGFAATLGPLPAGVRSRARLAGAPLDVVVFFSSEKAALEATFAKLKSAIAVDGAVWISWPKKASGQRTDLDENVIRALGLAIGLVDVKVCAVDDVWSGLKFVVPKAARHSAGSAR